MSVIEIRPNRKIYVDVKETTWPEKDNNDDNNSEYDDDNINDESCSLIEIVVLLIHGSCAHSGQWDAQVDWLIQQQQQQKQKRRQIVKLRIVRYDYFGCGQSMKPHWKNGVVENNNNNDNIYSALEHYDDLLAIYERCCCCNNETSSNNQVWVMGHSFGCSMALRLAAEKNDRITKLVLISPVSMDDFGKKNNNLPWIFHLPVWLLSWIQPVLTDGFIKGAFHPNTANTQPDLIEFERIISNSNPPYMFKSFYLSMADYYSTEKTNEKARSSWFQTLSNNVNALIICGEDDQIVPSLDNSRHLGEKLTSSQISVVDNASHQVMQEQPHVVNSLLASYLFDDDPTNTRSCS